MKKIINDYKKELIFGLIGLLLVVSLVIIFFSSSKSANKLTEPIVHEKAYVMYLKINPLVKLDFKEVYKECFNESGDKYVCEQKKNVVTNYQFLNNDAKTMFYNLDINEKELNDVIVMLCDTAKEKGVKFDSFELTSNYNLNKNELESFIKNNSNNNLDLNINYNYKENIDENEIIGNEDEKEKIFVVTFDSNGGNKIDNQLIKENEKVNKPVNPTRNGYTFIKWVLDGKEYDFNTAVTGDITIKAEWKNNDSSNINNSYNSNNNNSSNSNNTSNNNNNSNNTNSNSKNNSSNTNNNNSTNNNDNNSEPSHPIQYVVNFDHSIVGPEQPKYQLVNPGEKATKPADPVFDGYTFIEWQLNGKKYDFNTPVNSDIILIGKWERKTLPKPTNVKIINLGIKDGYLDLKNITNRVVYKKIGDAKAGEVKCAHDINGPYNGCEYFEEGEVNNYGNNRIKLYDDGTYVKVRYVDYSIEPTIYSEYSDPIYIPPHKDITATKSKNDIIISNADGIKYIVCEREKNTDMCFIEARLSGNRVLKDYLYNLETEIYIFPYYKGTGYEIIRGIEVIH